jgi:hypothetical protein
MRLHPILREVQVPYQYEREVEEFLRWSPHVRDPSHRGERHLSPRRLVEVEHALDERLGTNDRPAVEAGSSTGYGIEHYDDLTAGEIVPMLESLESSQLAALADHERSSRGRRTVLVAIDRTLARRGDGSPR